MAKMFVYYKGTLESFKSVASNYNDKIVFIKGGENGDGAAVYTHGQYFGNVKDALAALQTKVNSMKYFSKISDGTNTASVGSADGTITFSASNPQLVSVDIDSNGVNIGLAKAFTDEVAAATTNIAGEISRATEAEGKIRGDLGQKGDAANAEGSAFARIAKLAADIDAMTGGNGSIADQINAAVALLDVDIVGGGEGEYIASVKQEDGKIVATKGTFNFDTKGAAAQAKSDVIGTSADEASASTIYGAKKYADAAAIAAQSAAEDYADGLASNYDAAGSAATAEQNAKNYAAGLIAKDSDFEKRVAANETAIGVLNGEGAGSVKKAVADAVAGVVASAPEDFDTLKEVADWIASDTTGAAKMQADIAKLNGSDTVEGSVAKQVKDAVKAEADRATGIEGGLANRIQALEGAVGSGEEGNSLASRMSEAEGDIDDLEALMSSNAEGSVNKRISDAVAGLKGDAADEYNTLGKLEDKIIAEAGRADTEEKEIRKDFAAADTETLNAAKKHADDAIAGLNVTDTAVENQFVTAVSESAGKITVSRASVHASQIGITNTESDHFAAGTQNVQAALNELASFWEWEVIE